jgi:hypothetical protein
VGVVILTGEGPLAFCSGGDQSVRGAGGYVGSDGIPRLNVLDLQMQVGGCWLLEHNSLKGLQIAVSRKAHGKQCSQQQVGLLFCWSQVDGKPQIEHSVLPPTPPVPVWMSPVGPGTLLSARPACRFGGCPSRSLRRWLGTPLGVATSSTWCVT